MASIQETVADALTARGQGSYLSYAEPVIAALVRREQAIFSDIVAAAVDGGYSSQDVRLVLTEAGLTAPPVVAVGGNGASLSESEADELASIRHDLSTLMERIDGLIG
jgi:hypothetical protein